MLFDQPYFKYRRFALIDETGGYLMSRLKYHANPVITEEFRELRGRAIPLEGKQIQDVAEDLHREIIDAEIEAEFQCRLYEGTRSLDAKQFRVVGVLTADADGYHLYITNFPREELFPRDIAMIYRCRWEVELLFRELKSRYELDEFDTTKKHVVEIFVYAALLTLLVSREQLDLVSEHAADEAVFPSERWAATFRSHAQLILHELSQHLGYTPPSLIDRMAEDSQKSIKNDRYSRGDSLPLHKRR